MTDLIDRANGEDVAAPEEAGEVLSATAHRLVQHLTRSVQQLRLLHQLLDDDPTSVEARRVLGRQFAESAEALGVARSFDTSISRLEHDGPVTASALLSDEAVVEGMTAWVRSVDDSIQLVVADLTAIGALATSWSTLDLDGAISITRRTTDRATMELIGALAHNAIDRLDVALPPRITSDSRSDQ